MGIEKFYLKNANDAKYAETIEDYRGFSIDVEMLKCEPYVDVLIYINKVFFAEEKDISMRLAQCFAMDSIDEYIARKEKFEKTLDK